MGTRDRGTSAAGSHGKRDPVVAFPRSPGPTPRLEGPVGEVFRTPSQRFSRRYLASRRKTAQLHRRALRSTPGGVESNIRYFKPHPMYVDYGDAGYLYDVDGNKVLDFMMGFGALLLGHNNRDIALEVIKQLESGSMLGMSTPLYVDYLETVKAAFKMKKARLTNSGTEATMHALRVARAYTGKEKIAKAEGAYHGAHDAVLQSLEIDSRTVRRMREVYDPIPFGKGIPRAVSDLTVVFPYNDVERTEEILEKNADDLAAVIIEPVLCGPGVVIPKGNYLRHLRRITRKLGIVLIFDEVLTGFRLAYGGAQQHYGVKPDLTTFGKIAGGGFQIGGFGGEAQIIDVLEPGEWKYGAFHAGTYNGHPVSVAAGMKALEILEANPGIYSHINGLGRGLFKGLQDLADDRRIPAWVEWVGSMGTVYFTTKDDIRDYRDTMAANTRRWWNWFIHCLGRNVLFGIPGAGERAFICSEHTPEDVQLALEVADDALAQIQKDARRRARAKLSATRATRRVLPRHRKVKVPSA